MSRRRESDGAPLADALKGLQTCLKSCLEYVESSKARVACLNGSQVFSLNWYDSLQFKYVVV